MTAVGSASGTREVRVGDRLVGAAHPPFVIAEVSGNHNGSLDRALAIVDAAADSGAHALKLQTYTADTITIDVDGPAFRVSQGHELWEGARLYDLYSQAHTPWEWHEPLFERARARGMVAFSSPFDETAIALLERLDVPLYKIASSELVDLPLIRAVAGTGKPVILSTGMATPAEIDRAVSAARGAGCSDVVLLSCTSDYPADPAESHLRGLPVLADAFDAVVGLSDHTEGIGAAVVAVALGAAVIEKHVTVDRAAGGVDAEFSLEPAQLAALVTETHRAWLSLGEARIGPRPGEQEGLRFRRSLYVVDDVEAGEPVTADNVRSIRPAGGLEPDAMSVVLGRRFTRSVTRGTPLSWELI
jgi:pseudaminic acid synthase